MAIQIFSNTYNRRFFNDLISSQLDVDRLDYLVRDSFYCGVTEGNVGLDRILSMLNVRNDRLVVEEKAIYSLEKFIISRRLMYWQVYLHKTVLSAEAILQRIIFRAKHLFKQGYDLGLNDSLRFFIALENAYPNNLTEQDQFDLVSRFSEIDDSDIIFFIKKWQNCNDLILSKLCSAIINRKLFKVITSKEAFSDEFISSLVNQIEDDFNITNNIAKQLLILDTAQNRAYSSNSSGIRILYKNESIMDISEASEILDIGIFSKQKSSFFVCFPCI